LEVSQEIKYGKLTKRIVFTDTDHRHAQFILRLKHDNIKQSDFFRAIITGYIDQDESLQSYVDSVSQQSQLKISKSRKLREAGRAKKDSMGLSNGDVTDIFDLIAQEHPEL
jgi:hypothetical protein